MSGKMTVVHCENHRTPINRLRSVRKMQGCLRLKQWMQ